MQNTLLNMRGLRYPKLAEYQFAASQIIIFFFYFACSLDAQ